MDRAVSANEGSFRTFAAAAGCARTQPFVSPAERTVFAAWVLSGRLCPMCGRNALSLRLRQWLLPTQGEDCQLRLNTPPDTSKWLRNWRESDGQPSGSVVSSWPFAWATTVKIGVL